MGWFDGNPAHLWEHPPVEAAKRHVSAMGGVSGVLKVARKAYDDGDYRWAVQVLNYLIFDDPGNEKAKMLQASSFEQPGYGCENGTWRNFYLSRAYELRNGNFGTPTKSGSPSVLTALSVDQVFDSAAFRVNGPKAWDLMLINDWVIADENKTYRTELRNGVLIHYVVPPDFHGAAPRRDLHAQPSGTDRSDDWDPEYHRRGQGRAHQGQRQSDEAQAARGRDGRARPEFQHRHSVTASIAIECGSTKSP
jgi:hypothetical protein